MYRLKRVYFNPRPREEGDPTQAADVGGRRISIHALVKRATKRKRRAVLIYAISIHALVKRATDNDKLTESIKTISIHALVKRATKIILPIA